MDEPGDPLRRRVVGYTTVWLEAVERQHARVVEYRRPFPPQPPYEDNRAALEADLVLFAVAVRNLIRAVEWASNFEPGPIGRALTNFDNAVPHAVDIRDMLDHFDAYEQGRGKLQGSKQHKPTRQQPPPPAVDEYAYFFVHTNDATSLVFKNDLTLNVGSAADAAKKLGEAALAAL